MKPNTKWYKTSKLEWMVVAMLTFGTVYGSTTYGIGGWVETVGRWISYVIDYGSSSIYDNQSPPAPQQPPPGNQGPCPCGTGG